MSSLQQVLSEYAVPLKVWLSPGARTIAADPILAALSGKAEINTSPISSQEQLKGPAVLLVAASEINGSQREDLQNLAKIAHPGRVVLVGGTSDRDVLMDAINHWGVFRVVAMKAEAKEIVDAVLAAGTYLKREVALETAIDDLDIENTMLDSAIDQVEGRQEQARLLARSSAETTISDGMHTTLAREEQTLRTLAENASPADQIIIHNALSGIETLVKITEQFHDRAIERAAGIPVQPEPIDELVSHARNLCTSETGQSLNGHLGSGAKCTIDPFAFIHVLLHLCRNLDAGPAIAIDTHTEGHHAVVLLQYGEAWTEDPHTQSSQGPLTTSWTRLTEEGVAWQAIIDPTGEPVVRITIPIVDTSHA
jgi:hypothetical protein